MSVLPAVDLRSMLWVECQPSNIEYLIEALADEEEQNDQEAAGGEEKAEQEET